MINLLIEPHILSRLFDAVREIKCTQQGLFIRQASKVQSGLFAAMTKPPCYQHGRWYGVLTLTVDSGQVSVKVKPKNMPATSTQLQKLWLKAHSERMIQTATLAQQQLKYRYLSASLLHTFRVSCQQLWQGWQHIPASMLDEPTRQALAVVAEIAAWTNQDINEFKAAFVDYYLRYDQAFFAQTEAQPLTPAQAKACIIQDDRQLLLAGAGTGKTSVIKAKVAYLLHRQLFKGDEILLLAYGNDAADEMRQRCQTLADSLTCATFHALSLSIIEHVEGQKPAISTLATSQSQLNQFVQEALLSLQQESDFARDWQRFCQQNSIGSESQAIKLLCQLLPLVKQAQFLGHIDTLLPNYSDSMTVIFPLLAEYQLFLNNENSIDFEDMLQRAIHYVETKRFNSPWRMLLVDEFQDISQLRARLLQALLKQNPQAQLFAVGDDWQAIYRFSGGDISLITEFSRHFGEATTSYLDKTFRYPQTILDVASQFVCRNPEQIPKHIVANDSGVKGQGVVKVRSDDDLSQAQQLLGVIEQRSDKGVTVMLLARNHKALPDSNCMAKWRNLYPQLQLSSNTFHGAKGTEADFTIIMGLQPHILPSNKPSIALVEALLPAKGGFPDAEERRLFYVALTRAKRQCFVIEPSEASYFLKEIT
ncbi:UvrD-helicase domain-containing protein [Pseudoalteromonas 'SMAR']|uniref:UvrD-helicase domain-containing protein n=1 Tax=Pseudoalteromonas 'SMAR' TaxID=3416908 RepID=UPI003AF2E135